jgi:holo-[acyl-carrier protein] synthase
MEWHDCEVSNGGAPQISVRGSVAKVAADQGITNWHVSLSHDGPVAIAYVIAEKV